MEVKDKPRFAAVMNGMAEIYGAELTELSMDIWFKVLAGYSIQEVEEGAALVLQTRVYCKMPTPGEIIQAMSGRHEDRALQAWLDRNDRSKGKNPVTEQVIEALGGRQNLRSLQVHDLPRYVEQFVKFYVALSREQERAVRMEIADAQQCLQPPER